MTELQPEYGLYALHLILVELRSIAFSSGDMAVIAEVLDWAEAMPFMLAHPDQSRLASFRNHLAAIAERDPRFARVLTAFDSHQGFYGVASLTASA